MSLDVWASEAHYFHHISPIIPYLPEPPRVFLAPPIAHLYSDAIATRVPPQVGGPIITAGHSDALRTPRRPVVLIEHGAGQTYTGSSSGSYAGGKHRGMVDLFLCPNDHVTRRNQQAYPNAVAVTVGSPRVESLAKVVRGRAACPDSSGHGPATNPTVAVSFHWECHVAPESRSAFPYWRDHLGRLAAEGWNVIGHGHPRAWTQYRLDRFWPTVGARPEPDLEAVLAVADVFIADNTSSLYEAAALDIPVVVLNAPWYRRDVHHGLRFWEHIPGPQVDEPAQLTPTIHQLLETDGWVEERSNVTSHVYGIVDGAAHRAANTIVQRYGLQPL